MPCLKRPDLHSLKLVASIFIVWIDNAFLQLIFDLICYATSSFLLSRQYFKSEHCGFKDRFYTNALSCWSFLNYKKLRILFLGKKLHMLRCTYWLFLSNIEQHVSYSEKEHIHQCFRLSKPLQIFCLSMVHMNTG